MKALVLAIITTIFTSAAQIVFKQGILILGLIFLATGFFTLRQAFKKGEFTTIFPILALSYALVAIASMLIFKEILSLQNWLGILAIIIGVSILGRKA